MEKRFAFKQERLSKLPIPDTGKRDTYWDEKVDGLQVRVTSNGIKTFCIYFWNRNSRKPERITLGRFDPSIKESLEFSKDRPLLDRLLDKPNMNAKMAHSLALAVKAALNEGNNPNDKHRARRSEITLGELFEDFIQNRRNRRGAYLTESSKRGYQSSFDVYLKRMAKRQLSQIKDTELAALHTKVGREFPTTANRVIALASSLFSYAKERKLFTGQNPADGIRKFPENARDRFIQADELPRFFQALAEEENETIRDYVLLSLLTGARRSNMLAMQWKDINLDRGEWRLLTTKNGTPQTVTLSPEAIEILRSRKPEEPEKYVFPSPGKVGHLIEPKKGWERILERAGIEDLRIHDLRRTLGSWQAKQGASLVIIGKSLNHKTPSTTAIYARLDLDPVRESVNRATSAMLSAAGLKEGAEILPLKTKRQVENK